MNGTKAAQEKQAFVAESLLREGKVTAPCSMQEGSTLQSALCAALSSLGCPWPAVIPVHDPLRDACWGVAVTCSGTTAFLDSDSIHISNLPEKLLHVSHHFHTDIPWSIERLNVMLASSCCSRGVALLPRAPPAQCLLPCTQQSSWECSPTSLYKHALVLSQHNLGLNGTGAATGGGSAWAIRAEAGPARSRGSCSCGGGHLGHVSGLHGLQRGRAAAARLRPERHAIGAAHLPHSPARGPGCVLPCHAHFSSLHVSEHCTPCIPTLWPWVPAD